MVRSLWTAASGMIAQQENVDTIANNLANVNTTGYKTQTAEFKSLLYQTLQTRSTNNAGDTKPVSAQVGLGSRTAAITSIFTDGNLNPTENPWGMAISGDGFFKVRNENGEIMYTRDGNFTMSEINGNNMLCTSDGNPVLDANNNPILIPGNYNATSLTVDATGVITVKDAKQNIVNLGQILGIAQFNNPAGLEKASGNLYRQTVASGAPMEESTSPNLKKSTINQGYIEASNVQVVNEMVNLIVAQRAYEMNSKAITASDEMLQQANNLRK